MQQSLITRLFVCFLVFTFGGIAHASGIIASGALHSAAVKQDGTVWAWGYNYFGQLGNGTTDNANQPTQASGITDAVAVAAGGSHTMALKKDGTVWVWGSNEYGQLGDGTTENRNQPVQVVVLNDVKAIAAGGLHSVALKKDGTVWAWGYNEVGQLGNGTTQNNNQPLQTEGLINITAISAGMYHTAVLKEDGTVYTWGYNEYGQIGNGTNTYQSRPVQLTSLMNAAAISAGGYHTVALKQDDTAWAWGLNQFGQLGDGTTENRNQPVQVKNMTGVSDIAAGGYHTMALKPNGTVWAWGFNADGEMGNGTNTDATLPGPVTGLTDITAIAAGYWHNLALQQKGRLWAWGFNEDGELGDGTNANKNQPVLVNGLLLERVPCDINNDGLSDMADVIIALQAASGLSVPGIRADFVTSGADVNGDGKIGMPEAIYILDAVIVDPYSENTPPATIAGPGGSSLNTPLGGLNGGAAVTITAAADTDGLIENSEIAVSGALVLTTTSEEALFGDGTFSVSIPLDPSKINDPNKLLLKVLLSSGAAYSLLGTYDAEAGVYRVELSGIVNGWKIIVVEDPAIKIIQVSRDAYPAADGSRGLMAWLTDLDWETLDWTVVNHTNMSEDDIKTNVLPVLWDTSETLAHAGFRAPKIYIDPRLSPPKRVCHLIGANNPKGSHFHAGSIQLIDGTWVYTEDQENFTTILLDDEELSALGQMYVDYDQSVEYNTTYGVTLGNIVVHELFHAVQYGYDVRKNLHSMRAYIEGTATPLGQTYQDTGGSVTGPSISVRTLRPGEHARLYQAADDPKHPFYYTKQDFFAYVSKRYGGNSFQWTEQLFEYMSFRTANKFGLTTAQYRTLYRKAMDEMCTDLFSRSLSRIYREYALDRAYEHGPDSVLRPAEETEANGFGANHLAETLFKWGNNDSTGIKKFDPKTLDSIQFPAIEPLSCYAFSMTLPDQADPEAPAEFPLLLKLEGGEILPSNENGIKIILFLEDENSDMVQNGRIEVTATSDAVIIPFHKDATSLTGLIMNCYIEDKNVKVTVSAGPYIEKISPSPAVPGDTVTLLGLSFGATKGESNVYLGDTEITEITRWNNTRIEFKLPQDAESDKIKVVAGGATTNEVYLEILASAPDSFDFVQTWSKSHFPSGWGVEPDTIDFTVTFTGQVLNAINPVIEVKNFYNSVNKYARISNMKRTEVVTVTGTFSVELSTYTVSPTTSSIPQHRYVYTYSNPRLILKEDGVLREEFPGMDFTWVFDAEEYYSDIEVWILYDVETEYYKREEEDSNFVMQDGYPRIGISEVYHLEIEAVKDVASWDTP